MINLLIFLVGLGFLLYFSYQDLKHSRLSSNKPILILSIISMILLIYLKSVLLLAICLFYLILGLWFWKFKVFGGADTKVLPCIIPFVLIMMKNYISGAFIFLILLGTLGTIYAIIGNLITKKKEIPFMPIITLSYAVLPLFS